MARRQIVGHGVNLELYAATHGEPNIIGQAIGGIGTVLGEAFDQAKDKKNKADKEAETKLQELTAAQNKISEDSFEFTEEEDRLDLEADILDAETTALFNETLKEVDKLPGVKAFKGTTDPAKGITDPAKGKVTKTYEMYGDEVYSKYLKDNPGQIIAADAARSNAILEARSYNTRQYGTHSPTSTGQTDNKVEVDENGNLVSPLERRRGGQRGECYTRY